MLDFYPFTSNVFALVFGVIGLLIYRFKNPNQRYLNVSYLMAAGVLSTEIIYYYFIDLVASIWWLIFSVGLVVFYSLRLKRKATKGFLDYVKFLAMCLILIIYPLGLNLRYLINVDGYAGGHEVTLLLAVLYWSIVPIIGAILFLDKMSLKLVAMKTKVIPLLLAQSLILIVSIVYSFFQQTQAYKARELALRTQEYAQEAQAEAERNALEARNQAKIAEELAEKLRACQGQK